MTIVAKCFTVFALVASLAFLGVVSVSAVGGKNFEAELHNEEYEGYAFTPTEADDGKVTWSAETRLPRRTEPNNPASKLEIQKVATNKKVLPQAMIDVLNAEQRAQKTQIDSLDGRIEAMKKKLAAARAAITADKAAIKNRLNALSLAVAAATKQKSDLSSRQTKTLDDASKKQLELKRRKEEIARLEDQVEILKADKIRLDEQLIKLAVVEKQLQGEVNAARSRNKQLKQNSSSSGSTSGTKSRASTTSLP